LEIYYFEEIDSTQKRLVEGIKRGEVTPPVAYLTYRQTGGIGSRGNSWIGREGNLFFSFALGREALPPDLPFQSASIYFSFLLKEKLAERGSSIWLKWPNDFYIGEKKVGGCITQLVGETLVCGIGLNIREAPQGFGKVDVEVDPENLLESYFEELWKRRRWKEIFSKYKIEFEKSREFRVHSGGREISLKEASLAEDGGIVINGERIYSLR